MNGEKMNRAQRRSLQTREKIIQAGRILFKESGYHSVAVADIMALSDLGHGTFYQHFKNKKDLLLTILKEFEQKIELHSQTKISREERSIWHRIFIGFKQVLLIYYEYKDVLPIVQEAKSIDEDFRVISERIQRLLTNKATRDYEWCEKNGLCHDVDADVVTVGIVSILQGVGERIITESLSEDEVDRYARNIATICCQGLFKEENVPQQGVPKVEKTT